MRIKHSITLSEDNHNFALSQAEKYFGSILTSYINYLISKDKEKVNKKLNDKIENI